jgi:protease I
MGRERIICLLGQGFEDSEFRVPYDRVKAAGYQVDIVGTQLGEVLKGYKGKESVAADKGIDEVRPDQYGALLIPGGQSPDHLRADDRFVSFVRDFDALGLPVAAVCHGPQLLMAAGLVQGRTLTAWKTVQGDLEQMGAIVLDQPVVIDGNWITSRKPQDLEDFSDALIGALGGRDAAAAPPTEAEAEDEAETVPTRARSAAAESPAVTASAGNDRRDDPGGASQAQRDASRKRP